MEIGIRDLAAIKRVNKNSKAVLAKLDKKRAQLEKLSNEYEELVAEYKMWESPVTAKWGYYSEQILSGEADRLEAEKAERLQAVAEMAQNNPEPEEQEEPLGNSYHEDTHVEEAPEPVWGDEDSTNEDSSANDNPFED